MEINYDFEFKIILVGDSCTGKSYISSQYVDNFFDGSFIPTIGVDFKLKIINLKEKTIKLQIWDTAGQERFRNIISTYFKNCNGIILVYDVTNKESFKNISQWIRLIEDSTQKNNCKVLVGNKCDLNDNRLITEEEGKKLAEDYDMIFFEASAKTAKNINEIFNSLLIKMANLEN